MKFKYPKKNEVIIECASDTEFDETLINIHNQSFEDIVKVKKEALDKDKGYLKTYTTLMGVYDKRVVDAINTPVSLFSLLPKESDKKEESIPKSISLITKVRLKIAHWILKIHSWIYDIANWVGGEEFCSEDEDDEDDDEDYY